MYMPRRMTQRDGIGICKAFDFCVYLHAAPDDVNADATMRGLAQAAV